MRALYDSQVQYLSAVCRRYLTDEDDVKDVLQESFVKIFSSLRKFSWRGEGSLRAWMKRIVVNEALMVLRRASRLDTVPVSDSSAESVGEEEPQTDGIPMAVLQKMIRELPDGYRTVFNLYVLEGMSHKEIASLLGISEGASYSQFRASSGEATGRTSSTAATIAAKAEHPDAKASARLLRLRTTDLCTPSHNPDGALST